MIGVLGGTFDPIHFGHLRPALDAYQHFPFKEIRFIPCNHPPHRGEPIASADHRLQMVKIAIDNMPGFIVDDREIKRDGPSYMVDTLISLRREFPNIPLCLILGLDSFVSLNSWNRWEKLIELAHILVLNRPGVQTTNDEVNDLYYRKLVNDPEKFVRQLSGCIMTFSPTQFDISASKIRQLISEEKALDYLMPDAVIQYIRENGLYN